MSVNSYARNASSSYWQARDDHRSYATGSHGYYQAVATDIAVSTIQQINTDCLRLVPQKEEVSRKLRGILDKIRAQEQRQMVRNSVAEALATGSPEPALSWLRNIDTARLLGEARGVVLQAGMSLTNRMLAKIGKTERLGRLTPTEGGIDLSDVLNKTLAFVIPASNSDILADLSQLLNRAENVLKEQKKLGHGVKLNLEQLRAGLTQLRNEWVDAEKKRLAAAETLARLRDASSAASVDAQQADIGARWQSAIDDVAIQAAREELIESEQIVTKLEVRFEHSKWMAGYLHGLITYLTEQTGEAERKLEVLRSGVKQFGLATLSLEGLDTVMEALHDCCEAVRIVFADSRAPLLPPGSAASFEQALLMPRIAGRSSLRSAEIPTLTSTIVADDAVLTEQ